MAPSLFGGTRKRNPDSAFTGPVRGCASRGRTAGSAGRPSRAPPARSPGSARSGIRRSGSGSRTPRRTRRRDRSGETGRRSRTPSRPWSRSAAASEPLDRIEGQAAVAADLEVEVGSLARVGPAGASHHGAALDGLALAHVRALELAVEAVVAAVVVEEHAQAVGAELRDVAGGAGRDRVHRCPFRRGDADAVPADCRVPGTGRASEA